MTDRSQQEWEIKSIIGDRKFEGSSICQYLVDWLPVTVHETELKELLASTIDGHCLEHEVRRTQYLEGRPGYVMLHWEPSWVLYDHCDTDAAEAYYALADIVRKCRESTSFVEGTSGDWKRTWRFPWRSGTQVWEKQKSHGEDGLAVWTMLRLDMIG
ncbi:hypothetical protein LTR78_007441 [Recurvomyces mirabilis]|uniref:Uncharacterized protein n=1 Tax=Recurvomyces mirabilis TaxID=574656 RepID=A0AAE0TRS0_9PEZI|nr:hypothetical protein LTR78_007441 [Recurvomyces mirabilis]KAK4551776.1 hypothetical protein LTR86_010918 [Recurvomyces mirabilis]KAK5160050.1 hypothetical protein LTS14_002156 [Recurvomyces mirabilis]